MPEFFRWRSPAARTVASFGSVVVLALCAGCPSATTQEQLSQVRTELRELRQQSEAHGQVLSEQQRLLSEQHELLLQLHHQLERAHLDHGQGPVPRGRVDRGHPRWDEPRSSSPSPGRPEAAPPDFSALINDTGQGRYEVPSHALDLALSDPARYLVTAARIVPSVKDGRPSGFKLFAIRPQSIYSAMGLKNGDVMVAVNGMAITTPDSALEVYTQIRQAQTITLRVLRKGEPLTLHYRIVNRRDPPR